MRLTLRTLLAYLDDVLESADAHELGQKIDASDFARGLVQRIRSVTRKKQLGAPRIGGKGMGLDANTVAEYLDSTLPQERVPDFEKVCLESDVHLSEVAACHQILTLVLGEPAEYDRALTERVYAIQPTRESPEPGNSPSEKASPPVVPPPAPQRDANQQSVPPSPDRTDDFQVAAGAASGHSVRWMPIFGTMLITFLLAVVALVAMGPLDATHPVLGRLFRDHPVASKPTGSGGNERVASETKISESPSSVPEGMSGKDRPNDDDGPGKPTADDKKSSEEAPSGAVPVIPAPELTKDAKGSDELEPDEPDTIQGMSPGPDEGPRDPAGTDPAKPDGEAAADGGPTGAKPAGSADRDQPEGPEMREGPGGTAPDAEPLTPDSDPDSGPASDPASGVVITPAGSKAPEAGRYTSDQHVLALFDESTELWQRVPPLTVLPAERSLVAFPTYRPQLALPNGLQVIVVGPAQFQLLSPPTGDQGAMTIETGRFLLVTDGKSDSSINVQCGERRGSLTFVNADSAAALEVTMAFAPGTDPETAHHYRQVDIYSSGGPLVWHDEGDASGSEIPVEQRARWLDDGAPHVEKLAEPPSWLDASTMRLIDRDASKQLSPALPVGRPISVSLLEQASNRLVEVRTLAIRSLGMLGEYDTYVEALNDKELRSYWTDIVTSLRRIVRSSPENAGKIRAMFERLRGDEGRQLYRLLWGYSPEQLQMSEGEKLVKLLEHPDMDVRVVAFETLRQITGKTNGFRPEREPRQQRRAVLSWQKDPVIYKSKPVEFPDEPAGDRDTNR